MKTITTSAHTPTEIRVEKVSENVAKIIAYPFETGYAVTVAHPLRRLLYTSSIGFAPTGVKINGVAHEFDSIAGMLEDVAIFIMNLKNLRFKLKNNSAREIVEYEFKGSKDLNGSDLINDIVDIVNPDQHVATLNEDADLKFTIIIEKGIGYIPSEELKDYISSDFMALDAFFTPVKRAIYDIENTLVDDNPDYEKIVFTITTNGQVTPIEAFQNALQTMHRQLGVFENIVDVEKPVGKSSSSQNSEYAKLFESIENLNLSARSFNCLDKAGIRFIGELALMEESILKDIKNLGKKSLEEIKAVMEEIGYPVDAPELQNHKKQLNEKIQELKNEKNEG
ncbi:DNA-directed RNA polymerase subunit alpha [Campylobacter ureolyticus]|uniref:DNA-directed RNA polymerase subunit alpha n=1 Tax=Campylobacter ureolyticus TaxID=827 RepID=A0A9Q4KMQ2_9BACT|nr:DNA-directed RNA polymerase subunit alpha [Campylobacter ureolyticus]MCZ6104094.1 DNA-directed RNA polymerase subunit alpha [Campylobacter ureolyticus]MCZ6135092.1 DNA-directed RNA polymerase subunit alpha [Campylobacter ureolyticus]MCZ6160817.1 DNA-directed RNA polymerase subunit alpha [Campylobacter ureolyticus]MCZ6169794.1 DNA-directed RNA polymerase subunit alpha [Campylobacter ureolyticus]MDU4981455.1 DNA-directed RNA polymerase subunit alpha [Campylobacter ureolyticus]